MGLLQEGKWVNKWYDTKASNGHFVRKSSQFRNWITPDGAAGPTGAQGAANAVTITNNTSGYLLAATGSATQIDGM